MTISVNGALIKNAAGSQGSLVWYQRLTKELRQWRNGEVVMEGKKRNTRLKN